MKFIVSENIETDVDASAGSQPESKPITEETKPVTEETKPVTEGTKPVTEGTKPVSKGTSATDSGIPTGAPEVSVEEEEMATESTRFKTMDGVSETLTTYETGPTTPLFKEIELGDLENVKTGSFTTEGYPISYYLFVLTSVVQ